MDGCDVERAAGGVAGVGGTDAIIGPVGAAADVRASTWGPGTTVVWAAVLAAGLLVGTGRGRASSRVGLRAKVTAARARPRPTNRAKLMTRGDPLPNAIRRGPDGGPGSPPGPEEVRGH